MERAGAEELIEEFALEALPSPASVKVLTENEITHSGIETTHMSLTYFSCPQQTAGDLRDSIQACEDAYRATLPEAPFKAVLKIRNQSTCPHLDRKMCPPLEQKPNLRHLCLKCGLKAALTPILKVQAQVEAFITEHALGNVKRRISHLHMTLENDGPQEGEFSVEFDRFVLTPWPHDVRKRSLDRRFMCGWATYGFDHVGDAFSPPALEARFSESKHLHTLPNSLAVVDDKEVRYHRCCLCHQSLCATAFSRTQLRKCANKRHCSLCVGMRSK